MIYFFRDSIEELAVKHEIEQFEEFYFIEIHCDVIFEKIDCPDEVLKVLGSLIPLKPHPTFKDTYQRSE